MPTGAQYTVLGPFGFRIDGAPQQVGGPKQRAMFAALVIARGRAVSSESLATAAWNGEPPANYAATLQVYIAGFRRLFREAGLDPKTHLVTAPPGYRLAAAEDASDLARFDTAVRTAHAAVAAGRHGDAAAAFRAALAEFSGDVLADLRGLDFADEFATAVQDRRLDAVTGLSAVEIRCGRAGSMIDELASLTRAHPLREPLWEQLATALYVAGRQSDALDTCRRLRYILAEELGIDPTPAMQTLEARILRQESLVPSASPAALAATVTEDDPHPGLGRIVDADGRSVTVPADGLHIGRMPDNEVVVDHPKASRYHAVVSATQTGFAVRDLRSSNGTRVNNRRITDPVALQHGDRIGIGAAEFTFEVDDTTQPEPGR